MLAGGGAGTEPRGVPQDGNAFAELAGWRTVAVRGGDARGWLDDLVTADVEGLAEGCTRRSLLLTPTGRIRADFHVARVAGSFLLVQAPGQPEHVDEILAPYVLSSDVELDDLSERSLIVAVLGGPPAEDGDDQGTVAEVVQLDVGREDVRGEDLVHGLRLSRRLEEEEG
ncbi:MAG: hypothetical protein M3138_02520, partial [Actinomycetota bacterium]|nr:hypothetical protein [Actinomycetota bacterium]